MFLFRKEMIKILLKTQQNNKNLISAHKITTSIFLCFIIMGKKSEKKIVDLLSKKNSTTARVSLYHSKIILKDQKVSRKHVRKTIHQTLVVEIHNFLRACAKGSYAWVLGSPVWLWFGSIETCFRNDFNTY